MPNGYPNPDQNRLRPERKSRYWLWMIIAVALVVILFLVWWFMRNTEENQNKNTLENQTANQTTNQAVDQNENVNWILDMPEDQEFVNAPLPVLEIEEFPQGQ